MKSTLTIEKPDVAASPVSILLIGNNPVELGKVYEQLKKATGIRFITEIAFSLSDGVKKAMKVKPSCILVDDNLSNKNIKALTDNLNKDERTSDIPVTLLKSSNYKEVIASGIQDFLLKDYLTADKLTRSILNGIKYRKTKVYLYKTYKWSKRKMAQLGI